MRKCERILLDHLNFKGIRNGTGVLKTTDYLNELKLSGTVKFLLDDEVLCHRVSISTIVCASSTFKNSKP